jgi:2-keto-4-pentenoate hydratase
MAVAETEFVFTLGHDLPPRETDYSEAEVVQSIQSLHPGLEFPDSRFVDFTLPGTAGLIADNACAWQFVLGDVTTESFDPASLSEYPTSLIINGKTVTTGKGSDALGGPLNALVWIANTLRKLGIGMKAGQFVTTGVTGIPSPVKRGDRVCADLGKFGSVTANLV